MPHANLNPIVARFVDVEGEAVSWSTTSGGGAKAIARRLGIGPHALDTYMRSHGGVPDGLAHALPASPALAEGIAPPPALVQRALPSPAVRTPWVKRDRPRYFMAG